jgi:hypothetical protein
MLGLLFAIVVGLPAYIAVFNFLHEKQLRKSSAITSDIKKFMYRLDLFDYSDERFWCD